MGLPNPEFAKVGYFKRVSLKKHINVDALLGCERNDEADACGVSKAEGGDHDGRYF